jgi:putative NADPH-quinone reductase
VAKKIVIIQGHPDIRAVRFCRALADSYAKGAADGGHAVHTVDVARLDFPLLHTKDDFENQPAPPSIQQVQAEIARADHMVVIYPLWLGDVPAMLKAFFEQVFRPGFGFKAAGRGLPKRLLKGKSARVVVTMGMPALFYTLYFRAHGLKNLTRNILAFCGFGPIKTDIIGMIENENGAARAKWLRKMSEYGKQGI